MSTLPEYTIQQLALRNGQDREEVWCAYQGIIYDVSESRLWRDGKHYEHWAGQDLTSELNNAPHTNSVFDRFNPVGQLKPSR
ncbi:MAG: cytochrome b5 domain-containing protein [Bacteroidota bacterium]